MSAEANVTAARQAVPKPPSASSGAPGNTDDSCPLKTCGDCKWVKLLIYQRVMFVKVILCAVWRVTPSAQPLPVFQRFWLRWWFSRNIWSSRECGLQTDTGQMSFTLLNWACKTSIKGHTHMYIYILHIYLYIYTHIYWLVVSISLKNMKVSWDDYSQYVENSCSKPPTSHSIRIVSPCIWEIPCSYIPSGYLT